MAQKTILIADDEPYILHVLAVKLQNAGYRVVTAADGEEALELCLAEAPDLIVTDYQMAYLDGLQMCREYGKQVGREPIAMLITAREYDIQPAQIEGTGVRMILPKPFSPRQVVGAVREFLGEQLQGKEEFCSL
jgi:CheY-like chemotaxis protein